MRSAAAAPAAAAARLGWMQRHVRAFGRSGAISSGPYDRADDLVPENHGSSQDRGTHGSLPPVVDVGAADSAVLDARDRLARLRDAGFEFVDPQIAGGVDAQRLDGVVAHRRWAFLDAGVPR